MFLKNQITCSPELFARKEIKSVHISHQGHKTVKIDFGVPTYMLTARQNVTMTRLQTQ